MLDLLIAISRWVFLSIIICFLALGAHYIFGERGLTQADTKSASLRQRILIVLMHSLAFSILLMQNGQFQTTALVTGVGGLAFLLLAMALCERVYKNSDPLMWNAMFFLLDIGFIMLQRFAPVLPQRQLVAQKQLAISAIGFGVMLIVPLALKIIPRFEKLKWLYLALGLALLVSPFILGERINGAFGWATLAGVTFQASEIVKLLFVFYLASALYNEPKRKDLAIVCVAGMAFVLLLAAQRDLGGALIYFMTFAIMLYTATNKPVLFIAGGAAVGGLTVLGYNLLTRLDTLSAAWSKPWSSLANQISIFFRHVTIRVSVWQNPWADVSDTGYQLTQSLFAITTYGLTGIGLTRGGSHIIPVVERDFIFAAICEEFGVLFALLLIGVLILLFYRGVHIALRCQSPLYAFLSVGLTAILAFQTFIIIGGDIKLIPMTGVTLPFVSYGGTSVFVCIVMVGVLQWLYNMVPVKEKERRRARPRPAKEATSVD